MAQVNPALVTADMVDAGSFPRLSSRFRVMSVPVTVVNGQGSVVGAVPETQLVGEIRRVLGG